MRPQVAAITCPVAKELAVGFGATGGRMRSFPGSSGEGVSLEAQRAAIEQFASHNDIEIADWFEEKQTAAKKVPPPQLSQSGVLN